MWSLAYNVCVCKRKNLHRVDSFLWVIISVSLRLNVTVAEISQQREWGRGGGILVHLKYFKEYIDYPVVIGNFQLQFSFKVPHLIFAFVG